MLQFKLAEKAQHFTKLSIISHGSFDQGPADLKDLRGTTDLIMKQGIIITELIR